MITFHRRSTTLLLLAFLVLWLSSCAGPKPVPGPPEVVSVYDYAGVPTGMRQGLYHSVAPGETIWRIAKMYEVDAETIKEVNRISDVRELDIGHRLYIPDAAARRHVITLYPSRKWKYIIIHHSATDFGSSEEFNKAHLKRGWQGIGYHFVIDNGTCGKGNGQIETSPRWTKQMSGAHCKASGMNNNGIGICLVGNFSEDPVSSRQMNSLVYLTNTLRKTYKIPKRNIIRHGKVRGANTECPGKRFPWRTFWSRLGR
ncbi:MAG: N-acetylmuramoyl-L-alanine amidase [Candidatus Omnitrophica bacterium]|nr:N-acetylmuramoyl-L-alanine amidase [Candidatus Omnitrophota bacterium]